MALSLGGGGEKIRRSRVRGVGGCGGQTPSVVRSLYFGEHLEWRTRSGNWHAREAEPSISESTSLRRLNYLKC